jgi:hypothetical protein
LISTAENSRLNPSAKSLLDADNIYSESCFIINTWTSVGCSYCSQALFSKYQQELEPAIATTPGIPDIRIHLGPEIKDGALVLSKKCD